MIRLDRALLSSYKLSTTTIPLFVTFWPQFAMQILTGVSIPNQIPKFPLPVWEPGLLSNTMLFGTIYIEVSLPSALAGCTSVTDIQTDRRAINAVFGKVLRIGTEDITLHLISTNCMLILLQCLDVCPVSVADNRSLDFIQIRFLMKLHSRPVPLRVSTNEVLSLIKKSASNLILDRKRNFWTKFVEIN